MKQPRKPLQEASLISNNIPTENIKVEVTVINKTIARSTPAETEPLQKRDTPRRRLAISKYCVFAYILALSLVVAVVVTYAVASMLESGAFLNILAKLEAVVRPKVLHASIVLEDACSSAYNIVIQIPFSCVVGLVGATIVGVSVAAWKTLKGKEVRPTFKKTA
eukprot:CAMPEP_0169103988 /NCGR_PEP_ID=MMETSP1015-20121227/23016_1 /TAXON_ID=342587 /ORGANISM="Karlodinium micrum, Strain CCMP2283" /LENGTH=163 /DNA_ID=CAMNT_0009165237 /DNA_START=114 /DNA_END=605 /DNA_ORIENTATION=+